MKQELVLYILSLNEAAQTMTRAEGRSVYDQLLASAAMLLALVEVGVDEGTIQCKLQDHERQWGHSWLVDDVYKRPLKAWQKVIKLIRSSCLCILDALQTRITASFTRLLPHRCAPGTGK